MEKIIKQLSFYLWLTLLHWLLWVISLLLRLNLMKKLLAASFIQCVSMNSKTRCIPWWDTRTICTNLPHPRHRYNRKHACTIRQQFVCSSRLILEKNSDKKKPTPMGKIAHFEEVYEANDCCSLKFGYISNDDHIISIVVVSTGLSITTSKASDSHQSH